jgi:hypothetical protein
MIADDLPTLRRKERQERERADDSNDISERVAHIEKARGYAAQIAAIIAAQKALD